MQNWGLVEILRACAEHGDVVTLAQAAMLAESIASCQIEGIGMDLSAQDVERIAKEAFHDGQG